MFVILQAAVLIGLGICIENPEKRKSVLDAINKASKHIEKTAGDFLSQPGKPMPTPDAGAVDEHVETETYR